MADRTTPPLTDSLPALARQAAALAHALPKAVEGDARAVHRARVATRRLREALAVADAGKPTRRVIRQLTRRLGSVREMDVCRVLIRDLAAEQHWPSRLVNRLDASCERQRRAAARKLASAVDRIDVARLFKDIDTLAERLREREMRLLLPVALHARVSRRARDLSQAIGHAGALYVPERLHDVRKAAKKLRYAAEMSPSTGPRAIAGLRRLQDELGALHDLQMVQRRLQELAAGSRDAWVLRVAAELDRGLETRCREIHGSIVRLFPGVAKILDRLQRERPFLKPRPARARTGRVLQFHRTA